MSENKPKQPLNKRAALALRRRFSLRIDKADDEEIERRIYEGVDLSGATPWILMFAILVASVGLNVNSTAVIIGAMLISPLMGPIMGLGLGVAIYDFELLKRSFKNLMVATVISLIISTLYFVLTPIREPGSELLARTTPTFWDVLVAFFGGLAGIIGVTRREKSNVIPGVAIATALMPPICTAGYGIATGQWRYVGGATYLYTINCVFIAIATSIGIRTINLKPHKFADQKTAVRMKLILYTLALITSLPSGYLAIDLVRQEIFNSKARHFVAQEFALDHTHVADLKIDPNQRKIEVSLIGLYLDSTTLSHIEGRLASAELPDAKIIVHQAADNKVDVSALRSSLLSDLYRDSQEALVQRDKEIEQLKQDAAAKNALMSSANDIVQELRVQYPQVKDVLISQGVRFKPDSTSDEVINMNVAYTKGLRLADQKRIKDWFKVRTKGLVVDVRFYRYTKS